MFVSGLLRVKINSTDDRVHPGANRAVSIMIERVHIWILEAFIMRPAVPAFPDGCGSLGDRVKPGRPAGLFEQCIRRIQMTGFTQDPIDVRCTHKTGAEVVIPLAYISHKFGNSLRAKILGE